MRPVFLYGSAILFFNSDELQVDLRNLNSEMKKNVKRGLLAHLTTYRLLVYFSFASYSYSSSQPYSPRQLVGWRPEEVDTTERKRVIAHALARRGTKVGVHFVLRLYIYFKWDHCFLNGPYICCTTVALMYLLC